VYCCQQCGVTVKTAAAHCPLCHAPLNGDNCGTERTYPEFEPKKDRRLLAEGCIALAIILAHIVINLFVTPGLMWCVPSCATVIYSWLLVVLARKGKLRHGIGWKYQLAPVAVLLILYNLYVNRAGPVLTWYPTYGLSFCLALSLLINYGWMLVSRRSALDILPSQLIISVLGIVSFCLVLLRVIAFSWASVGTAALSAGTLIFSLVLCRTKAPAALQSYFHAVP